MNNMYSLNLPKWYFDNLGHLQKQGASNAGLETFKGNLIGSLTREICQNSLDAAVDKDKKVVLEFKLHEMDAEDVPGYEQLKKAFNEGYNYWNIQSRGKESEFFKNGLEVLKKTHVEVLRISDFNTTGLCGSENIDVSSPWTSLVLSEGLSNKTGSAGGSYGIGKSSIFAVSSVQSVFFNTFDINGIKACQGVSKLPSFPLNNIMRFGTGLYGVSDCNQISSCKKIDSINELYSRNEPGTDIYVMCFKSYSNWKDEIIISLLSDFLLAIFDSKLEVYIQDAVVNKDTLLSLFKKYQADKRIENAYMYYRVLVSNDTQIIRERVFEKDGIEGEVELKVLLFKDFGNRTILMSRSNGMKLFDQNRISSQGGIQFSAILTLHGEHINSFFSRMENPAHDQWDPQRFDDEEKIKKATKLKQKLYRWAKENIIKIGEAQYGDEIEVEGLEGLLPEFYDLKSENKKESLETQAADVTIKERKRKANVSDTKTPNTGNDLYEYQDTGVLSPDGEYDTKDIPKNKKNDSDGGTGAPGKGEKGEGNRPIKAYSPVNNYKKRMYISDISKNEYTFKMVVNQNLKDCRLKVSISGESSSLDTQVIAANSEGKNLEVDGSIIKIGRVYKGFTKTIRFVVDTGYRCNLEVKLYANNE